MSLEQVAKVTKIQQRILERLEAGRFDGLPAEVFVRGFVRSFARCVGLEEDEALQRYAACGAGSGAAELTPTVRALVEAMVDLAPGSSGGMRQPVKLTGAAAPAEISPVEVIDFAASSVQMRAQAGGEVVELMMLPETGTVVMPSQLRRPTMEMAAVVPPAELLAEAFPEEPPAVAEIAPVVAEAAPVVAVEVAPVVAIEAAPVVAVEVAPVVAEAVPVVEAPIETLSPPVEISAESAASEPGEPDAKGKKKRGRRGGKGRNKREAVPRLATGTPSEPTPVVALAIEAVAIEPVVVEEAVAVEAVAVEAVAIEAVAIEPAVVEQAAPVEAVIDIWAAPVFVSPVIAAPVIAAPVIAEDAADEPIATATWSPTMPPLATASTSVPWRRPAYTAAVTAKIPSLVIDDADPDSAERVLEERAAQEQSPRRSFLPPILLDREDRSGRQGGLTLAVIILLIAATLTLSYLMRRPSAGGDGMTRLDAPATAALVDSVG